MLIFYRWWPLLHHSSRVSFFLLSPVEFWARASMVSPGQPGRGPRSSWSPALCRSPSLVFFHSASLYVLCELDNDLPGSVLPSAETMNPVDDEAYFGGQSRAIFISSLATRSRVFSPSFSFITLILRFQRCLYLSSSKTLSLLLIILFESRYFLNCYLQLHFTVFELCCIELHGFNNAC